MITQYACNKPASSPLNVRLSAAKMRFTQSKVRMLHALCSASNLRAREEKSLFKQTLKVTFLSYHELMMFCLACQLLFLTGYYFKIYAK